MQKKFNKGRTVFSSNDAETIGWPCVKIKTKPKQKNLDTNLTFSQN